MVKGQIGESRDKCVGIFVGAAAWLALAEI